MKSQSAANNESGADSRYRDQVAAMAYRLYIDNGARPGHEMDDWLQAERLVAASQKVTTGEGTAGNGPGHPTKNNPSISSSGATQPEAPTARDERGSPSREEVRQKSSPSRSAPRQSQRPRERSSQPRSHTR